MEYTDRLMEKYITDSGKRMTEMVKDITGGQMEMKKSLKKKKLGASID